jgi:hypothetical protein
MKWHKFKSLRDDRRNVLVDLDDLVVIEEDWESHTNIRYLRFYLANKKEPVCVIAKLEDVEKLLDE